MALFGKFIIPVMLLTSVFVPVRAWARAGTAPDSRCIIAIRHRAATIGRPQAMPAACEDFGAGALTRPMADLFARLGVPDALSYSSGYLSSNDGVSDKGILEVSYLYPRDLNGRLRIQGHPHVDYSVLTVLAKDGTIRAGSVRSFAGLKVGDSKEKVFRTIGKPSHTDRPGELLFYDPYPFQVQLDDAKRKIVGLRVATTLDYMERLEGPARFDIRNSSGKIIGIKLLYPGNHR